MFVEDKVMWEHTSGLSQKVIRSTNPFMGHFCGYVRVPPDHPWYGLHYDDINVRVHGGLTYSAHEEDGYWIGFDCAHAGDLVPGKTLFMCMKALEDATRAAVENSYLPEREVVKILKKVKTLLSGSLTGDEKERPWSLDEVMKECDRLADQVYLAGRVS